MIFQIENGLLATDLDCSNKNLKNITALDPVPTGLVASSDSRLSDQRIPLDGSVTNSKVNASAAIDQSKLNLSGAIPGAWLGTTTGKAAPGDLAEYVAKKGAANGYAALDATGKVPASQMTTGAGLGTVTSVGLTMPPDFAVTGSPISGAGSLHAAWNSVPDGSWFGNVSGAVGPPTFQTSPVPVGLIPVLDASHIGSGIMATARLPIAVGTGPSSAPGMVPNPGGSGPGILPTDYLARDMSFKAIPGAVDDAAYGPSWNGMNASAPSKNAIYDWAHSIDTDDNGKVNVLDQGAGIPLTNSSGVLGAPLAAPSGALVGTSDIQNISNKRLVPRILSLLGPQTAPAINTDQCDNVFFNGLSSNITSMTTGLTGAPGDFDRLTIRFLDDGVARSIAWGASFFSTTSGILPTTTVATKITTVELRYNIVRLKWSCASATTET